MPSSPIAPAAAATPLEPAPRWQRLAIRILGHMLVEDGALLVRWRARLTAAFLSFTVTFGTIPLVPSVAFAIRERLWMVVVADLGLFALSWWMLLSRRVSNRARAVFLVVGCYLIGANAVIGYGPGSGVLGWLFMSVFVATFLLGRRASYITVAATILLMVGVAVAITNEWVAWATILPDAFARWRLTSLNFAFLITVFSFTNGLIMQLLETEEQARARMETQLAEARHHEALGTLAGGIAHDFNNLLVPVLSNLEYVRDRLPAASDERAALQDAQASAERARELVRRILQFGRGVEEERRPRDVSAALQEALGLARAAAPGHIVFDVEAAPVSPVLAADAELHQVLFNLLSNAVHAVEQQAEACVRVRVEPVVDGGASRVRVTVADTGAGMDARTQERIFDPYFSTKSPDRGTGLGLPIVRSIVRSLGGTISVESAPGRGSRFSVELPSARPSGPVRVSTGTGATPATPATPALEAPASNGRRFRVLVVDDEPSVLRATARLLERRGYEVRAFAQPREAQALVEQDPSWCDLLLTDYRMPGLSGLELAHAVRRVVPRLPIVLASGHLEAAKSELHGLEDLQLLAKPFSLEELEGVVRGALGR